MKIRHFRPGATQFLAALVCASILAIGCKKPDDQVIGKWNGPNNTSITFKADKTFAQTGAVPATGKWSVVDKKVTVNVETVNGKSPDELIKQLKALGAPADKLKEAETQLKKGMELTVSQDGKTMSMVGAPAQAGTLTKEESK